MTTLSFHYGGQTIQYREDDCFSCDTGVTTVKMSNVSEQRRQELSTMSHQLEQAKKIIEEILNDVGIHMITRRNLWTSIGSLLEALADPSIRPYHLALQWDQIRSVLRSYADDGGNRGDELRAAIETVQGASPVQRNALQTTWLQGTNPSPSPANEVPFLGGRNDSMSSVTGPSEGETPPSVAAADSMMSAGVAAAAAAEGGNHEGGRHQAAAAAAVAVAAAVGGVAEVGSVGEQTSRNTLDYSTSEASGIPFGSPDFGSPDYVAALEDGNNSMQSGGTAGSTRSGM